MSNPAKKLSVLLLGGDPLDFHDFQGLFSSFRDLEVELDWVPSLEGSREFLQERRHDACVLNGGPDLDSPLDFLLQIGAHELDLPVLVVLPAYDRGEEAQALSLGASDCLLREEITPYLLERALRYSLHRHSVKRELRARESERMMQERLAAVGILASGMAHEIGTPLAVIRGRAEVLLLREKTSTQGERDLQTILSQVDRVSKLMKSLLNLARGDSMSREGSIDLHSVVSEVLEVMSPGLREQGIEVKNEIPPEIRIRAQAEGKPFHQILMNLLMNSMQAIGTAVEQGRVERHSIRLSVSEEGERWALRVSDSGCGISPENQRRLFRPFFTTRGVGSGTGLGLALSLRIVESWKGSIRVESAENQGATFIVSVPKGG